MTITLTIPGIDPLSIAMLLYPGFTMLDLIGPQAVLSWAGTTHLVAKTMAPVTSDSGAQLVPTCTLADCPRDLDVLFVPGGFGTFAVMKDPEVLAFLADRGARAGSITSVCGGALILGAAGLLQGYRSTTHWALHDALAPLGAIPVKQRVVVDRNRISGGGVTAGIDFGLVLLAQLRGEETARLIQLMMEYDPAPPFAAGTPELAGPALTERARALMNSIAPAEDVAQPRA
ncbi:DJ-1/PfpI family protein [Nannocystis exedens]|uniref:DJ-1/PfpI family protein n=1 Tax=Nannocystis exedens TaxID=54 RepID=A0A1I2FWN3_9BACT|nr:DJ-1/PfpI family protein [Nannocystis exedens]PCC73757.1 Isonitrile hydratase [Nannocystis exedens]SFF09090.1 DJ-1/PfpI family protein [Nannocystis exedens]